MSYLEWQGERWAATDDVADLHLTLWRPDAPHPRVRWKLDLFHRSLSPAAGGEGAGEYRWIHVEVDELPTPAPVWRELGGWEVRADAAWLEAHEYTSEYGRHYFPHVRVACPQVRRSPEEKCEISGQEVWHAHDFRLRFGARDGLGFACELDAWMIHRNDYERLTPEDPADAVKLPAGPPNLRVLALAQFKGGHIYVPRRYHADPVGWAREALRAEIGYEEPLHEVSVKWALRQSVDCSAIESMPGWGSTVNFRTEPYVKASPPAGTES